LSAVSLTAAPSLASGTRSASPAPTAALLLPNAASGGSQAQLGAAAELSTDGKTAILGAPARTVYSRKSGEGDAYVLGAKGWSSGTELTLGAPAGNGSYIGESVAVSGDGNTVLVGAPLRGIVGAGQAGAAYLYTRANGTWGTAVRFNLGSKAKYLDEYGRAVALSADGRTALIGAPNRTADGSSSEGAGEIYTLSGGKWQGPTELSLSKAGGDSLGWSAALSANGHIAILGAPNRGDGGTVEVFTLNSGKWRKTAELSVGSANSPSVGFGVSVALNASGTTALVGTKWQPAYGAGPSPGAAEVFVFESGRWHRSKELNLGAHATSGDDMGASVSLNAAGTRALVGAPGRAVDGQTSAGAAELFTLSHGQWGQPEELSIGKKAVQGDMFGTSVALDGSGSTALVGAPGRTVGNKGLTGVGEIFKMP